MYRQLKDKADDLYDAMNGYIRPAHLHTLKLLLGEESDLTQKIERLEDEIKLLLFDSPEKTAVLNRIIEVPGFTDRSASLLLAEIGFDLSSFPDYKHFCSWAGLSPGKKESAGINKSGRIQVRQHYLRSLLVEIAFAATRCKDTYYRTKYYSLKVRIGSQKAIIAIARKLAIAIYKIVGENKSYCELSSNYVSIERTAKDLKYLERLSQRMDKDAIISYLKSLDADTAEQ